MNRLKRLFLAKGLIVLTISFFACEPKSNGQNTTEEVVETEEAAYVTIPANEFKSRMEAESGDFLLIDVRTKGEFDAGAIANADNYDISNGDFENNLKNWDHSTPIYVYCAKGGRSARAAKILESNGFDKIIELKGGYSAWKF